MLEPDWHDDYEEPDFCDTCGEPMQCDGDHEGEYMVCVNDFCGMSDAEIIADLKDQLAFEEIKVNMLERQLADMLNSINKTIAGWRD